MLLGLEFPPINELLRWQDIFPTFNKIALIAVVAAVVIVRPQRLLQGLTWGLSAAVAARRASALFSTGAWIMTAGRAVRAEHVVVWAGSVADPVDVGRTGRTQDGAAAGSAQPPVG